MVRGAFSMLKFPTAGAEEKIRCVRVCVCVCVCVCACVCVCFGSVDLSLRKSVCACLNVCVCVCVRECYTSVYASLVRWGARACV